MRKLGDRLIYSPSDLITFMESPFDSWMERYYREFPDEVEPDGRDESHEILAKHGNSHEAAFLNQLQKEGYDIAEIKGSDEAAKIGTIEAMRQGREIIYQGFLTLGEFAGLSDFLVRVDGASALGDFHYEVWDTKLSRKAKPYFLVQLCCYAQMLENIQDRMPASVRVVLGDLSQQEFRTGEYYYHYRQLKKSFLEFQRRFSKDNPPEDRTAGTFSRWTSVSERFLEDSDDLSRIANIRKSQIDRLKKDNLLTLTALAETSKQSVPRMTPETFETLKRQAQLQLRSKKEGRTVFEVLPPVEGKGLSLLPPQSDADVFFDMEGYPHMDGGLEYLFGAIYKSGDDVQFKDWWAHDRMEEKQAFEQFVDWVYQRWIQDPSMHIYHYASYEVSAMRRLAGRHATRVEEIDNLLRHQVFVDLFQVVRQGFCIGEPSYSIKYVEHLFRDKRKGNVAKATDSVVFYENWLEQQDGFIWQESCILKEIRDYNEEDCLSTLQLAQWLWLRQAEHGIRYLGKPIEISPELPAPRPAARLAQEIIDDALSITCEEKRRVHTLLAFLLEFHRREDKPMWWRLYDRQMMTDEELYHDLDCLSGLRRVAKSPLRKIKKSLGYEYSFDPDQDTKLVAGQDCLLAHDLCPATILEIDRDNGLITIVLGPSRPVPPDAISLLPSEHVDSKIISDSIFRLCLDLDKVPSCLSDLLYRRQPRLADREKGSAIAENATVEEIVQAISQMQDTCICIQGPPGTGKTYTASHTIVELLQQGKRVGITSNSHKAIDNLVCRVAELARQERVPLNAIKVGKTDSNKTDRTSEFGIESVSNSSGFFNRKEVTSYNLVAGTAWLFSNEKAAGLVDYLFVDEAGQVSLANVAGMSPATRNLILLGDQMQLEQPTEGSHPGESGQSCLEYLLQDKATIAEDMGVFLATTHRMHPDICSVISSAVYDSRLIAGRNNSRQALLPPDNSLMCLPKHSGIVWLPVAHSGNTQASDEEVDEIEKLINKLRMCCVADKLGQVHPVTIDDILVVAPYNMQVRKIASRIPGARVASVDKFQGQEAPIVILSMCSSEAGGAARGMDFLFSRNRLNVAISRAKTLTFVVSSPELLKTKSTSLEQMRLLNFFLQIVEAGSPPDQDEVTAVTLVSPAQERAPTVLY